MKFSQATLLSTLAATASSSFFFRPAQALEQGEVLDPGFTFGSGLSYGTGWNMTKLEQAADGENLNYLGGIRFSDNGNWMCTVDESERGGASVYCFELVRDPADGRVTQILADTTGRLTIINEVDGTTGVILDNLSIGFKEGPGGYDYASINDGSSLLGIGLFTWQFDAVTGRPVSLTLKHIMDFGSIEVPDYIMGLAFSNIVQDPNTGFGMLFGILDNDGPMVTLPLIQNGAFYDLDSDNVRFLCNPGIEYSGSLDLIPVGNQANNYVMTDWSNEILRIILIDSNTGYPQGIPNPPPFYNASADNDEPLCLFDGSSLVDLDPEIGHDGEVWGSQFDIKGTGDYFAGIWEEEASDIYIFHGFPPGYDVNVISANLAATLDALLQDISGNARKLGRAAEGTSERRALGRGDQYVYNKNVVRKTKKSSCATVAPSSSSAPSEEGASTRKTKSPGRTKSPGSGKKDKCLPPEPVSPGQQQTETVVASLENSGVTVTPELEAAVATATNPAESTLVQDAIATGVSSTELVNQMNEIDQLVASILPASPTQFQSESAAFITCLTDKISNTGTPSLAAATCTPPTSPPA